ncbi:MAG: DUF1669 domain-containing protein [Candidatus Levybacteria bacterium]|jgi:phosphatidylserine/phosphatidylglycerophosphate/cardiolipin synthase-like enzyme|nr:DUF1669 domain-containing protein [Candidatus Levybacteria bacterium]
MKTIKLLIILLSICTYSTAWGKSDDWFVEENFVCFSQHDDCESKIIDLISEAKKSIDVFAYLLTSKSIVQSLIVAHERGIKVSVALDGNETKSYKNSKGGLLENAGIKVKYIAGDGIFHHKIMIFDQEKMLTGSYNFTWSAQNRNHENILFLKNPEIINEYLQKMKISF